jgi:hypothetical protein
LPKDVLLDGPFAGMSAEEIYNRLDLDDEGSSEANRSRTHGRVRRLEILRRETSAAKEIRTRSQHLSLLEALARFSMRQRRWNLPLSTSTRGNGRSPYNRPKTSRGSQARCRQAQRGASRLPGGRPLIGANSCGVPGRRPFRHSYAGHWSTPIVKGVTPTSVSEDTLSTIASTFVTKY